MRRKLANIYHFFTALAYAIVYGYPARHLVVIGITGTDGKTTTSHLIYEILKQAGKKVALISTVAAQIDDSEIDTGFHVTTGDAPLLQPLIKKVVASGAKYLILETTSHALDQYRTVGCNFYIGVLTNVTHEHLDYHQTFAAYRQAKAKLFKRVKYAVLNKDDPSFAYFQKMATGKVVPYGPAKIKTISPALVGNYNSYNIGAALAAAEILQVDKRVSQKVIAEFAGVPGRRQEIKMGQKFRAIVDFAHTPNALDQLLIQLRKELPKGKKLILVFGCAGLRDHSKRLKMGNIAKTLADVVVITAEDPRTEELADIYQDITGGSKSFTREDDRQLAISKAIKMAKAWDIVVVTGKGHEKSMCFGTTEYPWSDQEAVEKAIKHLK